MYIANSWEEYSEQGPAFKAIENWWKNNWRFIKNARNSDYNSWTEWYLDKFYNEWGNTHRGPEETLRVMNQEKMSQPQSLSRTDNIQKRKPKLMGLFKNRKKNEWPGKNSGVSFRHLSPDVQDFLKTITAIAKENQFERPYVTSGYRSPGAQARAMSNNWNKRGGKTPLNQKEIQLLGPSLVKSLTSGLEGRPITKGAVYLNNLYRNKPFAFFVNNTLYDYGVNRESRRIISDWIDANVPKKSHMQKPATAVDLRLTKGIKEILNIISDEGEFKIHIVYEGDHYHVRIYGKK